MKAIDAIRIVLKFSDMGMKYLETMSDAPLLRPGPWGGNHAMWIAGHLTVVEGRLHQMLHGTENPVREWKPLFDWGSEPVDDPAVYPPYEQVLAKFKELRGQTHAPFRRPQNLQRANFIVTSPSGDSIESPHNGSGASMKRLTCVSTVLAAVAVPVAAAAADSNPGGPSSACASPSTVASGPSAHDARQARRSVPTRALESNCGHSASLMTRPPFGPPGQGSA